MVANMEVDMVADMEVGKVTDLEVDKVAVADKVADMEVDMVVDMEEDKEADMEVDMVADIESTKVATISMEVTIISMSSPPSLRRSPSSPMGSSPSPSFFEQAEAFATHTHIAEVFVPFLRKVCKYWSN